MTYPCAIPLWGDVVALAVALTDLAPQSRAEAADDIIARAINNRAEGKQPDSIMGVCYMSGTPSEPRLTDNNYIDALRIALSAIADVNDVAASRARRSAA